MLQNKISILSTRLLDDEFILDAQSQNLSIDVVSFIKTDPVSSAESGEEISRALAGAGPIAGLASNAKELADAILRANVNEVIFFCSDQRRDEMPDQLKINSIKVTEIAVYKTTLTPQKIEKNKR